LVSDPESVDGFVVTPTPVGAPSTVTFTEPATLPTRVTVALADRVSPGAMLTDEVESANDSVPDDCCGASDVSVALPHPVVTSTAAKPSRQRRAIGPIDRDVAPDMRYFATRTKNEL
jgi:hypothetical protein